MTYDLSDILCDLLNFAARQLTLNGRLVYWLPVYRAEYVIVYFVHLVYNYMISVFVLFYSSMAIQYRASSSLITQHENVLDGQYFFHF